MHGRISRMRLRHTGIGMFKAMAVFGALAAIALPSSEEIRRGEAGVELSLETECSD